MSGDGGRILELQKRIENQAATIRRLQHEAECWRQVAAGPPRALRSADEVAEGLPAFVRDARKGAGLTQSQIAEVLDRTASQVCNVESGVTRWESLLQFVTFCRATGADPLELLLEPLEP